MLQSALSYAAFALVCVVGPGVALQRLLRPRVDAALVLPAGLAFSAAAYWLSLVTASDLLFPVLVLAADAALLRSGAWRRTEGPSLRGALPACAALLLVLALTEYPQNRQDRRGDFLADPVLQEDAAFHVGLAYELNLGWPPQVPGLSGFELGYHLGLPLVRAAALRWAGIHPYDSLSRFDVTLSGLALVLALRGVIPLLGAGRTAVALVGFAFLASDPSFLLAWSRPNVEWWLALFEGSFFFFSILHANSGVPALALALASLLSLHHGLTRGERGSLALSSLLALAVPFFKVFAAAQLLLGLGLAAIVAKQQRRATLLVAVPLAVGTLALTLSRAGQHVEVVLDPLLVVRQTLEDLGRPGVAGAPLALYTLAWIAFALGFRLVGVGAAFRALLGRHAPAVALAAMALSGWPLGLFFRISPMEVGTRSRPFNEGLYFFEQSGILMWTFAAVALGGWSWRGLRGPLGGALALLLTLPSTLQFVAHKRRVQPQRIAAPIVRAMDVLARESPPDAVVLVLPKTQRHPPPPLVLAGRRVPYTRFIPYLSQFAPDEPRRHRIERVRRFFETQDAEEARAIAREVGATYVCLLRNEKLAFPVAGVLDTVYAAPGVTLYRLR